MTTSRPKAAGVASAFYPAPTRAGLRGYSRPPLSAPARTTPRSRPRFPNRKATAISSRLPALTPDDNKDVAAPQTTRAARRFALGLFMFLVNGSFGFIQPFAPLFLTLSGLTKSQFGLAYAGGAVAGLVIQPLLGRLSDRFDTRRPFMIACALASGAAYFGYSHARGFWAFAALTAIGVNGFQYLNAVGGVLAARLVHEDARAEDPVIASAPRERGSATYVRYRVWGSVGYVVVGLGAGVLVNYRLPTRSFGTNGLADLSRADLVPLFAWGPLLFVLVALVALIVPDARRAVVAAPRPQIPGDNAPPRTTDAPGENLQWFLAALFLYQFALYGASAFLPLWMKQLGARPLWITAMFAGGVVSEVLIMTRVGRWTDDHGRRPALWVAFLLMPLRLLLYIPATIPLTVALVQTLHGLNFGIMGVIAVAFVNDATPDHARGVAQARLASVNGLGAALGPLACGALSDTSGGLRLMFAAMSAVGVCAACVFATRVRESHPAPVAWRGRPGARMKDEG